MNRITKRFTVLIAIVVLSLSAFAGTSMAALDQDGNGCTTTSDGHFYCQAGNCWLVVYASGVVQEGGGDCS